MDESRPMNAPKKEIAEVSKKWKKIQTMLPDVIEYGIEQGIIPKRQDKGAEKGFSLTSLIKAAEADQNDKRPGDTRIHLPTNDITLMHSAVPFLPLPVAIFCAILNFIIPGLGTIMSGLFALCLGQTRVNYREGQKLMTVLINSLVGISQFFTITFLFVGWFWSMAWGGLLIIYSVQYRDALRQRRQEAIATAALEALTRDSILHRRDVKTLVIEHKEKTETKKEVGGQSV
ncbi:Protein stum [Dirofilaria immitis]